MLPRWLRSVHHDGSALYLSDPCPRLGQTVRVRLRVGSTAPLRRAFIRACPDGEQSFTILRPTGERPPARWLEGELRVSEPGYHYRFMLEAADGVWHYAAAGASAHDPLDATDFRLDVGGSPPAWVRGSVFYQVFPDRFAPGDGPRAPEGEEGGPAAPRVLPWGAPPPEGHPFHLTFYGGDLPGLARRLDHVARVGATALYLNPVFTAPSNHRYDVADYEHVDPRLGGDAALARVREALDARGLRYLLDLVPNHLGVTHPWFQAARADPRAPEAAFFTFGRHPDDWFCWLGVRTLPKLDYRSAELRRRMFEADDAVVRRWLRPPFSADGWRIDVANMLGRQGEVQLGAEVARALRRAVKEARPDAYLLGEHFYDGTGTLQGDQWDGLMNYGGFAFPLRQWLGGYRWEAWPEPEPVTGPQLSTEGLEAAWRTRRAAVPWAAVLQQYNLVGSHDVPRLRTVVGGRAGLHRLAAVAQHAYPGVPAIYYGDEIGLEDVPGLGPRACMPWDEARWDHDLLELYRALTALRRRSPALQEGGFQMLSVEPDGFAFLREAPSQRVLAVAHRGERPRPAGPLEVAHGGVPDGTAFVEVPGGREAVVRGGALPLPEHPQGASLWVADGG